VPYVILKAKVVLVAWAVALLRVMAAEVTALVA
jgi:hypothetical protein